MPTSNTRHWNRWDVVQNRTTSVYSRNLRAMLNANYFAGMEFCCFSRTKELFWSGVEIYMRNYIHLVFSHLVISEIFLVM
jgi:hypothetical protein